MSQETSSPLSPAIFRTREVAIGKVVVGGDHGLALIAGPCVIEGEAITLRIAERLRAIATRLEMPLVFKASFDKANRTSAASFRGYGIDEGLRVLEKVKRELEMPVTTDVHLPDQAAAVAEVVDLLQIPAFLSRQTDLLEACGATGAVVNIKKGQFLSPWDMKHAVGKVEGAGAGGVLLTERGASFGYQNLVVDLRSLAVMRENGWPVVFDATHSVQLPGAGEGRSSGQRQFIPTLLRGAVAAGVDAVFLEVHEDPSQALSDGPNMVALHELEPLLVQAQRLHRLVREK